MRDPLEDLFTPLETDCKAETQVIDTVRPESKPKDLGELATIHHKGSINMAGLIQPLERFLFFKHGQWYDISANYKSFVKISREEVEKYIKTPGNWVLLGPFEQMPGDFDMYGLWERKPNSNLYKGAGQ